MFCIVIYPLSHIDYEEMLRLSPQLSGKCWVKFSSFFTLGILIAPHSLSLLHLRNVCRAALVRVNKGASEDDGIVAFFSASA